MRRELEERLCEDFPELFAQRHGPPEETAMGRGFECQDGWYPLIRTLCETLCLHLDEQPGQGSIRVVQVKEKLGGLRFRVRGGDEYVRGAIDLAERMSYRLCEVCGRPADGDGQESAAGTRCGLHRGAG